MHNYRKCIYFIFNIPTHSELQVLWIHTRHKCMHHTLYIDLSNVVGQHVLYKCIMTVMNIADVLNTSVPVTCGVFSAAVVGPLLAQSMTVLHN